MQDFGELLREYRKCCLDPERNRSLTQERLAILLEEASGSRYTGAAISEWERGKSQIHKDDRNVLVGLIKIFHQYNCLHAVEDANKFLLAGNYAALSDEEKIQVDPVWKTNVVKRSDQDDENQPKKFWQQAKSIFLHLTKNRLGRNILSNVEAPPHIELYPPTCGDVGINLAQQRLLVSTAFGTYYAGLLERDNGYVALQHQIESPASLGKQLLSPIERIFWALQYPKGPQIILISGEGGMGKSTLSAKIIRCLFAEKAIDMILGDSAKTQKVDVFSGNIVSIDAGYYDPMSCFRRLSSQLGLPFQEGQMSEKKILANIRNRLEGRRALIIIDNLETVAKGNQLLQALRTLTNRDVRAIVTTRNVGNLIAIEQKVMNVHLRPILELPEAKKFIAWHIQQFSETQPDLQNLPTLINENKQLLQLLKRTGGIPLLIQLVLNDVLRFSWSYLSNLPQLFGKELLEFLYLRRWDELGERGQAGDLARQLLIWISNEQYQGQTTSFKRLSKWAADNNQESQLQEALRLLTERFLIINYDAQNGNFALFPSLVEFLQQIRK